MEKQVDPPAPGDTSLCAHCGNLNVFGADMKLIDAPQSLKTKLLKGPDGDLIRDVQQRIRQARKHRNS